MKFINLLWPNRKVTRHCSDCGCAFKVRASLKGKWGRVCPSCLPWYM